jgi:hypothetical protein
VLAILISFPFVDGAVKAATGSIYGVKGAVYYEVGSNGEAMFATGNQVDGGLFLLRNGARNYDDLSWGDVLQAGTDKNFRSLDGPVGTIPRNPKIFVLRPGECVVVLSKLLETQPKHAASGGWIKVATTSCGLFK